MSTLEAVQEVFREVFGMPQLIISRLTNSSHIDAWDSLNNVNLLIGIQRKFAIKFGIAELQNLRNVGDIIDLIEKKKVMLPKA